MKSDKQLKQFAKRILIADESITNSQLFNICKSEFSEVNEDKFIVTLHRAIWFVKHNHHQQRDYRFW